MPAKYSWAFENPNKNINDRVLRVQVPVTKPARKGRCKRPTVWRTTHKQEPGNCAVAFDLPVCSLMLAGASEYFRVELEKYRKPGEPVTITVDEGQQVLLRMLIKFIYTDELPADDASVLLQLLLLAQQFTVDECVVKCAEAVSQPGRLSYELALDICLWAAQRECLGDTFSSLCQVAADVILDNFRDLDAVWADQEQQKAFLKLPLAALKVLLGHADLQVRSENTVFLMTAWWLEHMRGRLTSFTELHPLIRWCQMTGSFLHTVFSEVPWLVSWKDANRVRLDAVHHQLAHDVAKKVILSASPTRAPRPRPEGSIAWPSLTIKVLESDLHLLDKHVLSGAGESTLFCDQTDQLLIVAGYVAELQLTLCERSGGAKGLAVFVLLRVDMPGQQITPSDEAMLVYSWSVTMRNATTSTTVQQDDRYPTAQKMYGRWLLNADLATADGQDAPVTQALRDAGLIKDGGLELTLRVTCAT